jgi:hypothetical protein
MLRVFVLLAILAAPHTSTAATLVTWASEGEIVFSQYFGLPDRPEVPAVGTPYLLTLTLDPSAAQPTFSAPAGSGCVTTSATGSLTVGSATYGLSGAGFTHAMLPGSNCSPGAPETQFLLGINSFPEDGYPAIRRGAFMEFWFADLLVRDAFPMVPTTLGAGFQIREEAGTYLIRGAGDLKALDVQQPTPVPEPGTMALVGLGLAAAIRRARRARNA